jgi:hypothetical protein
VNVRGTFMCQACDMDAPVQDDTRWEDIDFIGIWQHGALRSTFGQFGA